MRLVDALLGEHGIIYVLIDKVDAIVSSATSMNDIQCATAILASVISAHSKVEDELLDPALELHMGKAGPLAEMRAEHDEIKLTLQQIEKIKEIGEAIDRVALLLDLIRSHFQKEEVVLFTLAQQLLPEQAQIQLGTTWAEARGITISQTTSIR